MSIIVIGCGIAGASAALALAQQGHSVSVFDQAEMLSEIGAGLQISPNGMRVLNALGLEDQVRAHSYLPTALEMRNGVSDRRIFSLDLETALQSWGSTYAHIRRAHLQNILLKALRDHKKISLNLGHKFHQYAETKSGVRVHFENGIVAEGACIVGADGVHSKLRSFLFGETRAWFTQKVAWRATMPLRDLKLSLPTSACVWTGLRKHVVTTRIDRGETLNFVGICEGHIDRESWEKSGDITEFHELFSDLCPLLNEIVYSLPEVKKWLLHDRASLHEFNLGKAVLIGDSAHPMLPSFAQGAVMALEDSYALAHLFDSNEIEESFGRYSAFRLGRARKVQQQSLKNLNLFHQAGVKRYLQNFFLSSVGHSAPDLIMKRLSWLYGYDIREMLAQAYS